MARTEDVLWAMAIGLAYLVACLGSVVIWAGILIGIEALAGDWVMVAASITFILAFAYIAGRELTKR